jgi:hypothetical protein
MANQTFQLVMQKGPNPGKIFELVQDEIIIGRDISNRIVINDPEVSRRHTRLIAQSGGYVVEDMGSTNGTFVDGQRLTGPQILRPGQIIMLGEKISLAYEVLGYDPNATLIGGALQPSSKETYRVAPDYAPQQPAPQAAPPPAYQPPAAPAYQPPAAPAYQPPAAPAYQPPAYQPPAPTYAVPEEPAYPAQDYGAPAYSGQVPPGPPESYEMAPDAYALPEEEEPAKRNRMPLYIGCGVLLVILCCVVVGLVAFDTLDLYCTAPFDALSGILWSCPP